MNYTDKELAEMLRSGERGALKHLFDVYYRDMVIHSMKIVVNLGEAEEIVQDVFIGLWKNRAQFSLEKKFSNYLFASVRNRSLNYLKSGYGSIRFDPLDPAGPEQSDHPADRDIHLEELRKEIAWAIDGLPPKCRKIFNLSRNAGMSAREIAAGLELSEKTVYAQLAIAVKKIREQIGDSLDIQ